MINYVLANSNGSVTLTGVVPTEAELPQGSIKGVADQKDHYVLGKTVVDRPVHSVSIDKTTCLAYDQEIITLSGVSNTAVLIIDGVEYPADGTDIQLTFYEPKVYTIRVEDFPKLDFEVTINVS